MYTEEWKKSKQRYLETFGKKVEALGFDNPDTAVITALEKLISEPELKSSGKEQEIKIQELRNRLEDEQRRTQELQKELEIRIE